MNRSTSGLLLLLVSLFLHVLVVLVVRLQQLVPPGEGGGVVPNEVHVVEVVETGAGVERDQVERVQRDVVTTEREQEKQGIQVCQMFVLRNRQVLLCLTYLESIFSIKKIFPMKCFSDGA